MWSRPKVNDDSTGKFAMTLIVHKMNGETFEITVDPWTATAEAKILFQSKTGFVPESQKLIIREYVCSDQHRISRYTNLRSTNAFLTIVNPSIGGVTSSSSSSGVNPYAAAPPPEPEQPPVPEPEPIVGYANEEEAREHDLSEAEAEHDLIVLLRNLRRAREAAEEAESENEEDDAEESDDDHDSAEEDADATDAAEIDSDHDHVSSEPVISDME